MELLSALEDMRPSHVALLVAGGFGLLALLAFLTDHEEWAGPLLIPLLLAVIAAVLMANM